MIPTAYNVRLAPKQHSVQTPRNVFHVLFGHHCSQEQETTKKQHRIQRYSVTDHFDTVILLDAPLTLTILGQPSRPTQPPLPPTSPPSFSPLPVLFSGVR